MANRHRRGSSGRGVAGLTPAERRRVLEDWNDTARVVPEVTLPELFEAQAARTPDAAAVIFGGVALSYAELNARANRLAAVPDRRWARVRSGWSRSRCRGRRRWSWRCWRCSSRARRTCRSILAYPADRIGFMLADARPVAVLTTVAAGRDLPGGPPRVVLDDPAVVAAVSRLAGDDLAGAERRGRLGPSQPGVRDLHVGVDRAAEGGGGRAPQRGGPGCAGRGRSSPRRSWPGCWRRRR